MLANCVLAQVRSPAKKWSSIHSETALQVVESCAHHTVLCARAHEATACKQAIIRKPKVLKTVPDDQQAYPDDQNLANPDGQDDGATWNNTACLAGSGFRTCRRSFHVYFNVTWGGSIVA